MPVDFDGTVLAASMAAFSIPCTIYPKSGTPAAYQARGIIRYVDSSFMVEDGTKFESVEITFGIRLSTFLVYPAIGDVLVIPPNFPHQIELPADNRYTLDRFRPDGQGGASLVLKAKQPTVKTG